MVGIYEFELKATDSGGLTAKGTSRVTVNPVGNNNQSPITNAGADKAIVLPNVSTELIGRGTDPEESIVSDNWRKISGPSSFTIVNLNMAETTLKNLVEGTYLFEFKVTDNGGSTANDLEIIVVNPDLSGCPGCWDY